MAHVTKSSEHINNLKDWKPSKAVIDAVPGMGLEFVEKLKYNVAHDFRLFRAIIPHYQSVHRAFVLNGGITLVYGLKDVFYHTGLPISGKPVVGCDENAEKLFKDAFDMEPPTGSFSGTNIRLKWLRDHFKDQVLEKDSPDFKKHVKAYMLYFIGSYVLPDAKSDGVSPIYLPLLEDPSQISSYAWGAAALAHLHVNLEKLKENSTAKQISAQCYPLMLFFLEHIPLLLHRLLYGDAVEPWPRNDDFMLPTKFPLIVEWTDYLHNKTGKHKRCYEDILENLLEDQVIYEPYDNRVEKPFLPVHYEQSGKWSDARTTLHCFEKCVYHRPDLSPKQFGFEIFDKDMLRPILELKTVTLKGPSGKDFQVLKSGDADYPLMLQEWEKRSESVLKPMQERPSWEDEDLDPTVKNALAPENMDVVISTIEANQVRGRDLQCLLPNKWLNDEIINFYFLLLKKRETENPDKCLKCYFFNTFFCKKLKSKDKSSWKKWIKNDILSGYDKIFVPIHQGNHWCLGIINPKEMKIQYLDSLGGKDSEMLENMAEFYVYHMKLTSKVIVDMRSWTLESVSDAPRQLNGFDCGMFLVKGVDFYSKNMRLSFKQEDMLNFRWQTLKEIVQMRVDDIPSGTNGSALGHELIISDHVNDMRTPVSDYSEKERGGDYVNDMRTPVSDYVNDMRTPVSDYSEQDRGSDYGTPISYVVKIMQDHTSNDLSSAKKRKTWHDGVNQK